MSFMVSPLWHAVFRDEIFTRTQTAKQGARKSEYNVNITARQIDRAEDNINVAVK